MGACLQPVAGFLVLLATAFIPVAEADDVTAPLDSLDLPELNERPPELDRLHSLLVAIDGKPVLAKVYEGPGLNTPVNIKSLSKTVMAALAGIAIERGAISGPDERLAAIISMPEGADSKVGEITLGHLLSMQAGLQRTSGQYYGGWVSSDHWVNNALTRPFVDEPGGRMLYSTGSYHLLGAALVEASGESLLALTRAWLGEPLGHAVPDWPVDPQGLHIGGNEMRLSPAFLLALGELYRLDGSYEGKRLLSESWVATSLQPRGKSRYTDDDYGYGWFITTLNGFDAFYGRGYGGQMLYVIPDLAMTVVMTANPNPPASPGFMRKQNRLMEEVILPAVSKSD